MPPTYEYRFVELPVEAGFPGLADALNADGEEGWEAYQVDRVMKRVNAVESLFFVIFQKRERLRVLLPDGSSLSLGSQRRGNG